MAFASANKMITAASEEAALRESGIKDAIYPWNWSDNVSTGDRSPDSRGSDRVCSSTYNEPSVRNRRGRPKSETITSLILKGSSSASAIKCNMCCRVFPRIKSLQAHLRTHTGERPYICDFPNCTRAFAQSGQLKTHQRLHTGEKPFFCPVQGCNKRFTHSNRHCPEHPSIPLERDSRNEHDTFTRDIENRNENTLVWFEKYYRNKNERPVSRSTKSKRRNVEDDVAEPSGEPKTKKTKEAVISTPEKDMTFSIALTLLQLSDPWSRLQNASQPNNIQSSDSTIMSSNM